MQRERRKLEHIRYALELGDGPATTHFADVSFIHNCLPEINPADIDLSVTLWGKRLRLPFFIDALTGSTDAVIDINRHLARIAKNCGIGLAVGSEYGAVRDGSGKKSYAVVREENPEGLVFGNMSAFATPDECSAAVELVRADALEIHLNAAQEWQMAEGDKNFDGIFNNMRGVLEEASVPLIVKETGCGIAAEQYHRFFLSGFRHFNCAGAGGTNFPAIEARRSGQLLPEGFAAWGHPTVWSLIDAQAALLHSDEGRLFASGGVRTALDAAKAFALGADAVGIAAPALRLFLEDGAGAVEKYFQRLAEELRSYLFLLGCKTPRALRGVPLVISGETRDYLACRGYDAVAFCSARKM